MNRTFTLSLVTLLLGGCGHALPQGPDGPIPPRFTQAMKWTPGSDLDRGCLALLDQWRVPYIAAAPVRGVRTPVEIVGPVGGVRLQPRAGRAPVMDCELARTLAETAPLFRELGVEALSFSGAYDYRLRRGSHRLSAHAHGLAVDVHAFATARGLFEVSRDFPLDPDRWRRRERRADLLPDCIGHPGRSAGLFLRTLACRLSLHPALRLVITPDDNADHWNHFHIEAYPGSPDQLYSGRPPPRTRF
jgi:hypothetical protein